LAFTMKIRPLIEKSSRSSRRTGGGSPERAASAARTSAPACPSSGAPYPPGRSPAPARVLHAVEEGPHFAVDDLPGAMISPRVQERSVQLRDHVIVSPHLRPLELGPRTPPLRTPASETPQRTTPGSVRSSAPAARPGASRAGRLGRPSPTRELMYERTVRAAAYRVSCSTVNRSCSLITSRRKRRNE